MFGIFKSDPTVTISVNENEKFINYRDTYLKTKNPVYTKHESVRGKLEIVPPPGKAISHKGIVLLLIGEYRKINGSVLGRFFVKRQELVPEGELKTPIKQEFAFENVDFPCSSYKGSTINVQYFVQVVVTHRMIDFKVESPLDVIIFEPLEKIAPIHNEVGIKNVLHIEFVFPRAQYDCRDCVVGAVYFIAIKLRIVHMSLTLYRTENFSGDTFIKEKIELKTMEIMDGAPCRGDHIPIRFFVGDCDIWPYPPYKNTKLLVEHYIRAILVDENGKKYYKRLKVNFDRLKPEDLKL